MTMNDFAQESVFNEQKLKEYDGDGKCKLDHIYNQSDPRSYFTTLGRLEYMIPQLAKPVFLNVLEAYSDAKDQTCPKVVDLGCSYGINAALLKCGMELPELYRLYCSREARALDRSDLIERDREIFAPGDGDASCEVVGMDAAPRAVAYAREARIIDDKVAADLENERLTAYDRESLGESDLVISTGCVGYISEKTITKIIDASEPTKPWMAHFVLRMFTYEPIRQALAERGYVTAKGSHPVRQRRFASKHEQEQAVDRLIDMGIDPSGYETEGWYYADLYISRPIADASLVPCRELTSI